MCLLVPSWPLLLTFEPRIKHEHLQLLILYVVWWFVVYSHGWVMVILWWFIICSSIHDPCFHMMLSHIPMARLPLRVRILPRIPLSPCRGLGPQKWLNFWDKSAIIACRFIDIYSLFQDHTYRILLCPISFSLCLYGQISSLKKSPTGSDFKIPHLA